MKYLSDYETQRHSEEGRNLEKEGKYGPAVVQYNRAIYAQKVGLKPADLEDHEISYYHKGIALEKTHPSKAIKCFTKALIINPKSSYASGKLPAVITDSKDKLSPEELIKAIKCFEKFVEARIEKSPSAATGYLEIDLRDLKVLELDLIKKISKNLKLELSEKISEVNNNSINNYEDVTIDVAGEDSYVIGNLDSR